MEGECFAPFDALGAEDAHAPDLRREVRVGQPGGLSPRLVDFSRIICWRRETPPPLRTCFPRDPSSQDSGCARANGFAGRGAAEVVVAFAGEAAAAGGGAGEAAEGALEVFAARDGGADVDHDALELKDLRGPERAVRVHPEALGDVSRGGDPTGGGDGDARPRRPGRGLVSIFAFRSLYLRLFLESDLDF